tara:strand:- start:918 stop:1349 length:432 start_codon:yes stop_codon:yes gene_type:complete
MDRPMRAQMKLNYYFNCIRIFPCHDTSNIINYNRTINFTWDEIKHPIVHGIDITGRYFIALKLIIDGEKIIETIFQQFCDSHYFTTSSSFLYTDLKMESAQFNLITELLEKGKAVVKENEKPSDYSWIGKYVYIYDGEDILVR